MTKATKTAATVGRAVAAGATALSVVAMTPGQGEAQAATAQRIVVDSTADAPDASTRDGKCLSDKGGCTLRAAVMEANAHPGSTIVIPAGRYNLSIPPLLGRPFTDYTQADTAHGNLKIFAATTITGAGADETVIDGRGIDRVFTVMRPATITDLTVTRGRSEPTASLYNYYGGGAALNASDLTMERVHLFKNTGRIGGAVRNIPFSSFTLRDSVVDQNEAGEAGGIRFDSSGLVERSTISNNRVVDPYDPTRPGELAGYGGGVDVRGVRDVTLVDSKVTGNYAEKGGGGINITLGYTPAPPVRVGPGLVRLKNTTVTDNTRWEGPANCRAVLARFIDLGGNADSDGSCALNLRNRASDPDHG
ncbi:CSLREA domain-containing protein [Streptomyces sp. NPDC051636]|uniref:CSLREA domain-containing protein n=1 Tax=Streptomyces sp. NPDC051636 TaxID=3365663 RepID=UPI003791049C